MSNPQFNVINSNSLETLSKICAQLMERYPLTDPLLNEEIVVMSMGMRSFLTQEIAKQNQIAAQCNFQQIWQLIWSIHNKVNGSDDKLNRFDRSYIAWNIAGMRDIWSNPAIKGFEKLQEYVKDDNDGSRCYELAAKIADTFDQYQMYRPDWIAAFNTFTYDDFLTFDADNEASCKINDWINENARSKNSEGRSRAIRDVLVSNLWQVRLWCMLRSNFLLQSEDGKPLEGIERENALLDRAEVMLRLKTALLSDRKIEGLPQRVFIFGVSSLPLQVISFLEALSYRCPVFLFLLNPCAEYWGDIDSSWKFNFKEYKKRILAVTDKQYPLGENQRNAGIGKNFGENSYNSTGDLIEGNPLLLSFGKQARDNLALLLSQEPVPLFINAFIENDESSLLGAIQRQLLSLSVPEDPVVIQDSDTSLSVHACHTKRREIEVLRDAILQKFKEAKEKGEKLRPRDIVVMVPAINEYAPYISAVFGEVSPEANDYLPFGISDRTVSQSSLIAGAVLTLINISSERITNVLLTDLLSVPAIGAKFNIDADDVSLIVRWFTDNAVFWGLDDLDTQKESQIKLEGTFEEGLKRMVSGEMLGPDYDCYPEIEGDDARLLGNLAYFIRELKKLRDIFTPELSVDPSEWGSLLNEYIINKFFVLDDEVLSELNPLFETVDSVSKIINSLQHKPKITLQVFLVMLSRALDMQREFNPYLRDRVNFCSLVPMRAVPFKHVFILGLNDMDFPRDERTPGFNLMSVKGLFRRGDRSRGLDDRFLFLEALLSARKSIYFSYIGQSPVDRKELNPSVVLTELMDYICDNFTLAGLNADKKIRAAAVKDRIWCLEHMNSYHEDNFVTRDAAGKLPKIPSFDASSLVIPAADKRERLFLGDKKGYDALRDFSGIVPLSDLFSFLSNSSRYFLYDVLDIALDDGKSEDLSEVESFSLNRIERGSLIETLVYSDEEKGKEFLESLKIKGQLPSGIFGQKEETLLLESTRKIKEALNTYGCALNQEKTYINVSNEKFTVNINGKTYTFTLEGIIDTDEYCIYPFNDFNNNCVKPLLKFALKAALAALSGKGHSEYLLIDKNGQKLIFKGYTYAEAFDITSKLLLFFAAGRIHPYPLIISALKQNDLAAVIANGKFTEIAFTKEDAYVFGSFEHLVKNEVNNKLLFLFYDFYKDNIESRVG